MPNHPSYPPPPYPSASIPPGWYAQPPVPGPPAPPAPPATAPRSSALLVTSLVLAAAALAGVLGVVVWLAAGGTPGGAGGGGWAPLTGQVAARGGTLSGEDLATAVRQRIRDDGGSPTRMTCPDTARVAQNVTTVCHGVIDEDDWAVVVFFEDTSGNYTLLPV